TKPKFSSRSSAPHSSRSSWRPTASVRASLLQASASCTTAREFRPPTLPTNSKWRTATLSMSCGPDTSISSKPMQSTIRTSSQARKSALHQRRSRISCVRTI
ncbi:hypothetical protein BGZ52_009767, partial [Haplosporangium bisporale]